MVLFKLQAGNKLTCASNEDPPCDPTLLNNGKMVGGLYAMGSIIVKGANSALNVLNNVAGNAGGIMLEGATTSLWVTDGAKITVSGNEVLSTFGGAGIALFNKAMIVIDSVSSSNENEIMARFENNTALAGAGGGLSIPTASAVTLTSKHLFSGNKAKDGAAITFQNLNGDIGGGNCVRLRAVLENFGRNKNFFVLCFLASRPFFILFHLFDKDFLFLLPLD